MRLVWFGAHTRESDILMAAKITGQQLKTTGSLVNNQSMLNFGAKPQQTV